MFTFTALVHVGLALALAPLLVGIIHRTKAMVAGRRGQPFVQLYYDLRTGRCLFCRACEAACPTGAIRFTGEHRLAAANREDLVVRETERSAAAFLDDRIRRLLGRSLKLCQVSAGGCNACEADTNVLGTVGWDLGRFGIQFVASPRHADGLLITGPVPQNMRLALRKTHDAVPSPKIVIAVGACAISGGPYLGHAAVSSGARDRPRGLLYPRLPPASPHDPRRPPRTPRPPGGSAKYSAASVTRDRPIQSLDIRRRPPKRLPRSRRCP